MIEHRPDLAPLIRGLIALSAALLVPFPLLAKLSARRRSGPTAGIAARNRTNSIRWHDRLLEVKAHAIPRYCWLTVSIDVHVDGAAVIRTGGVLRSKAINEAQLDEQGQHDSLKLSWRSPFQGMDFPFQLSVDEQVIIDSKVRPQNWPMVFIPLVTLGPLFIAVFVTGFHLVSKLL